MKRIKKKLKNIMEKKVIQAKKNSELQMTNSTSPKFAGHWFYQVKKPSDEA